MQQWIAKRNKYYCPVIICLWMLDVSHGTALSLLSLCYNKLWEKKSYRPILKIYSCRIWFDVCADGLVLCMKSLHCSYLCCNFPYKHFSRQANLFTLNLQGTRQTWNFVTLSSNEVNVLLTGIDTIWEKEVCVENALHLHARLWCWFWSHGGCFFDIRTKVSWETGETLFYACSSFVFLLNALFSKSSSACFPTILLSLCRLYVV